MTAEMKGAPAVSPAEAPGKAGFFINREYTLLWVGQTISVLGTFVFDTTLVVWIAATVARGMAWAPLAVSGVFIAASLPPLLIAPLAGVIVDRVGKRQVMLVSDALRALLALAPLPFTSLVRLPFLAGRTSVLWTLAVIYAAVCALAICDQFFRPASLALLGALVAEDERPRAMGLLQGSSSLSMLVGPALAPPLLLAFGAQWALLINAVSFAVSFVTLLALRAPRARVDTRAGGGRGLWRELREGAVFLARSRALRTLTVITAIAMLGAGALNALDIFFTTNNLGAPVELYGLLNTALGLGLIAGSLLGGALAPRLGLGRTIWLSLLALGALVIVYARMEWFAAAALTLFITGAPLAAVSVAAGPLLLRETPARLVGRVESLMQPAATVATLAGAALAGYLDSVTLRGFSARALSMTFGPVDTIYCAAGVLILLSGVYALIGLRGADTPHAEREVR